MQATIVLEAPLNPIRCLLSRGPIRVLNEGGDAFGVGSEAVTRKTCRIVTRLTGLMKNKPAHVGSDSMVVMSLSKDSLVAVSLSTDTAILRQTARATLSHYSRHS
jgi:hypothetical protein